MTCLVKIYFAEPSTFQHSRFGLCLRVACEQKRVLTVGEQEAHRVVVDVVVTASVGSCYHDMSIAELYLSAHCGFRYGDTRIGTAVQKTLIEHGRGELIVGNVGDNDLAHIECIDY